MIFYTSLTCLTVLIALLVNNKCEKLSYGYSRQQVLNAVSLLSVFLLLFAVSALRRNVGNDYDKYCEYFHLIRVNLNFHNEVPTEIGFNLICLIIYFLCGCTENYLVMFAFFAFVTILLFMKAMYKQADSFPLTFFLFMTLGYYFQTFSTVRYYLALAIAFYAIPLVLDKKWGKFIALVILGATIHKSLLVVIPLYFLAQWTYKKYQIVLVVLAAAGMYVFRGRMMNIFLALYPTYEEAEYVADVSIISILRCVLVLGLSIILYNSVIKGNRRMMFFFYCNLGALLLYTFLSYIPVVSRIGYYLTVTHILFIPAMIAGVTDKKWKKILTILLIAAGIIYFVIFIVTKTGVGGLSIIPYKTFLYHDAVPIASDVT